MLAVTKMKKSITVICTLVFLFNVFSVGASIHKNESQNLNDIEITIDFLAVRALDEIDDSSEPDFFVKLFIDNEEFNSPVYEDAWYLYNFWSVTKNVSDADEIIDINIQLWDRDPDKNKICDINKEKNIDTSGFEINILYNVKTGHWYGDDEIGDLSGYGRANGCDDGSIYENEYDCELWFDIKQNDPDGDGIPYWSEVNVYHTDPNTDDTGRDDDGDGVPIQWEHKWGYDPFVPDDHQSLDVDKDALNNLEEYLTSQWNSDPYRKDIFLEMDYMEPGPDGIKNDVPYESFELLKNPFHRRNFVFHIDTEIYGGEYFPFDERTTYNELIAIYNSYFIKNASDSWRLGVFHYGIIVHDCKPVGFAFRGEQGRGANGFVISTVYMNNIANKFYIKQNAEFLYATNIMHEMGHNFGFYRGNPPGCDLRNGQYPWQINYWLYRNYKSVMNYRYTYYILDYSDGTHGKRDFNDWAALNLFHFQ